MLRVYVLELKYPFGGSVEKIFVCENREKIYEYLLSQFKNFNRVDYNLGTMVQISKHEDMILSPDEDKFTISDQEEQSYFFSKMEPLDEAINILFTWYCKKNKVLKYDLKVGHVSEIFEVLKINEKFLEGLYIKEKEAIIL